MVPSGTLQSQLGGFRLPRGMLGVCQPTGGQRNEKGESRGDSPRKIHAFHPGGIRLISPIRFLQKTQPGLRQLRSHFLRATGAPKDP